MLKGCSQMQSNRDSTEQTNATIVTPNQQHPVQRKQREAGQHTTERFGAKLHVRVGSVHADGSVHANPIRGRSYNQLGTVVDEAVDRLLAVSVGLEGGRLVKIGL